MSTPDQPATPPLTRRQLREIRNTGATPVLTPDEIAKGQSVASDADVRDDAAGAAVAPEPSSAETPDDPIGVGDDMPDSAAPDEAAPERDAVVAASPATGEEPPAQGAFADLGVAPLTRRQAREHERIRTASVPIIAPDGAPAPPRGSDADRALPEAIGESDVDQAPEPPAVDGSADSASAESEEIVTGIPGLAGPAEVSEDPPAAVVDPHFGSGLLAGQTPVVDLPPSFDQLIARGGSTGVSSSTPNALILSQTPAAAPLVAPVTATGEVLVTGSFDLPEGLGSVGHAPGLHDGKDADAVLVDGELPAASSPTPIAASAAISQVRNSDEIIRPPAPEKGGRLLIALTITAGALLVTVAGLLVLAFTTGIF